MKKSERKKKQEEQRMMRSHVIRGFVQSVDAATGVIKLKRLNGKPAEISVVSGKTVLLQVDAEND